VKFWCTPIVEQEFLRSIHRNGLPEFVTVLREGRDNSLQRSEIAASLIRAELSLHTKYHTDVRIVCECMDRMISSGSINATMIGRGEAVFMTANMRLVRACLYSEGHLRTFDKIIHEEGLEHLVDVLGVESREGYLYLISPVCSGVPQQSRSGRRIKRVKRD